MWANCPQRGDATPIDSLTDKTRVVPLRMKSERMKRWETTKQQKARDLVEARKRKRLEQAS